MTPEAKAKAAATRARNAEIKASYLRHGAERDRLSAKLTKVETFAADTRGNENERAVAVDAAERLHLQIGNARSGGRVGSFP
jgi:hypothetical protein